MGILFSIIVGGLAGWLAGQIMRGSGYGLIGNIVIGIVGGMIGGFLFSFIGFAAIGIFGRIITSVVGAILLIYVVRQIQG
ncbi:MAG: GlsB/YeaQ/YmgE family stress response membrane protein [Chloroflexota bacterium]